MYKSRAGVRADPNHTQRVNKSALVARETMDTHINCVYWGHAQIIHTHGLAQSESEASKSSDTWGRSRDFARRKPKRRVCGSEQRLGDTFTARAIIFRANVSPNGIGFSTACVLHKYINYNIYSVF